MQISAFAQSGKFSKIVRIDQGRLIAEKPLIPSAISIGSAVDILRSDGQNFQKIGRAKIEISQTSELSAMIIGQPSSPIQPNDLLKIYPEVYQISAEVIEIDRGLNYGLIVGTTAKIFRVRSGSENLNTTLVGRAIFTKVAGNGAKVRLIGNENLSPMKGDLIAVERQSTVRTYSGEVAYLDLTAGLMSKLEKDQIVFFARKNQILHPDGSGRVIEWRETIGQLKIDHIADGSYTARAAIESQPKSLPQNGDLISLSDSIRSGRDRFGKTVHILKIDGDRLYLNRFDQAKVGFQFTIAPLKFNRVDLSFGSINLETENVSEFVAIAKRIDTTNIETLKIGDQIAVGIYAK